MTTGEAEGDLSTPDPDAVGPVDFTRFWAAEYPRVVRLTFVLTGRGDVAEELAQDAFVAAYRRWDVVAGYDNPAAWVRRVATNAAVSSLRRRSAEVRALARLGRRREPVVELPDPDDRLWAAVRALPRRQAQVLALLAVDDMTTREVADALGCGEETVRTHARRGRMAVARRLGIEGSDE